MKEDQDAFGRYLYDQFEADENAFAIVIEREDGLVDAGDVRDLYSADFARWPRYEQEAMSFVTGRVLDIGCGAGRHALYLQENGFDVLGIDVSPMAVEVCKRRGLRQVRVMSISQVSSRLGTFDTILMMGHNFGLFGSFDGARHLLKKFDRVTAPGSRIVAITLDPYQTSEPEHLEYHKLNLRKGRMGGQMRLRVRYKKYRTPWFDYLFVSTAEMVEILKGTGWGIKSTSTENQHLCAIIERGGDAYVPD